MATIRSGDKPVVLIVDVQVGVMRNARHAGQVIGNVARVVECARAADVPVVWVQHSDADLVEGGPDWQWVPQLVRNPGETLIPKRYNSAFEETTLDAELARLGATHVVLAGASTNWCIRATAYGALDRGYDLTLVADAHTTKPMPVSETRTVDAGDIVEEFNTVLRWLEYPGRRNAVQKVDELRFGVGS